MPPNQEAAREAKRRYRQRNREAIREKGRIYAEQKRRASGIPPQGSPESSENRRLARKAVGAEHGNWKGDEVGYFALHAWVSRHKQRSGICQECGETPEPQSGRNVGTEWANISGEYLRDLNDWDELCVKCHRARDWTSDRNSHMIRIGKIPRIITDETREKYRDAARRRWDKFRPV